MIHLRVVLRGADPSISVEDDFISDHVPQVGDKIKVEGSRGEELRVYRIVERTFRNVLTGTPNDAVLNKESFSGVVLEVEIVD